LCADAIAPQKASKNRSVLNGNWLADWEVLEGDWFVKQEVLEGSELEYKSSGVWERNFLKEK
jgi:hypothetical protein